VTTHTIAAQTHGRYLIDAPPGNGPFPQLIGFHGYGESAAEMMNELLRIRGDRSWLAVSVQALNRFYNRSNDSIVANWMTREDRELAIADNLAYVTGVVAAIRTSRPTNERLVYVGFSQGAAMAYRAAAFGPPASGLIVLAGDVPPDVAPRAAALPPILIGRGTTDHWYTEAKAIADREVLDGAGARVESHEFDGGHVWDSRFVARASTWLDAL
jgi:predicted esterase